MEMAAKAKPSWGNLPCDIVDSIAKRLDVTSSIRASAVCTSWASAIVTPSLPSFHIDRPIPWLLLSAHRNSETDTNLTFYDLVTLTSYTVAIPIPMPSLESHRWLGSNKGWLVTMDPQFKLHLLKPLTGAHVLLPSRGIDDKYKMKVILCHTPDHANGFLAAAINGLGRLFVAKAGEDSWASLTDGTLADVVKDVSFYKGKLFGITYSDLFCWDIDSSSLGRSRVRRFPLRVRTERSVCRLCLSSRHLVEWRGELVVLTGEEGPWHYFGHDSVGHVELYKLSLRDSECFPSSLRSLEEDALFVGANYSYAISTSGLDNVRGNCVYLTNFERVSPGCKLRYFCSSKYAFAVFDLREGGYTTAMRPDKRPPLWFWPC